MRRFFVATLGLLALIGTPTAMALGLGEIQVRSALNQPFVAQIPLLAVPIDQLDAVRVKLADRADFERMGIERADYLSDLAFKVVPGSPPRIEISASRTVREPFLTLLLDVRSATGRVLREYTVFLDPPPPIIAAPSVSTPAPVAPTMRRPLPQAPTAAPPPATRPPAPTPVVAPPATAAPARAPAPAPAAAAATPPPPADSSGAAAGADRYTVKPGETLWGVATALRPDEGVDMNQVIYALVNANPTAFDRGRFEGLMKNVTLDVPRRETMLATPVEAARAGVAAWRRSGSITARATPRASVAPRRTPAPSAQATATPAPTVTVTVTPSAAPVAPAAPAARVGGNDAEVPAIDDSLSGEPVDTGSENPIDAAAALAAEGDAAGADADVNVIDGGGASRAPAPNGDATDTALTGPADAPLADAPLDEQAEGNLTELMADDAASAEIAAAEPVTAARDRPWWLVLLLIFMLVLIALLLLRRRRRRDGAAGPARRAPRPTPQSPPTAAAAAAAAAAGAGAASATHAPPDSVAAAQRQADEAEALFMAAYAEEQAEEQAEAERTRAQADPGNVDAIPDFDAAQIIDEPAADSDAPPPAALGSEADARSQSGWAKADALLSALDEPEPAPGDEVPSTTDGLDPLAEADTHVAFGLYDDALDTLDTALEREPQRADYLLKRAEVLLDAGRVRAFIAAASDARPHLDDAQWQSLAEAGRRVAPDEPLFATPGAVAAAPPPSEDSPPADDDDLPERAAVPEAPAGDAGLDFSFDELPTVPPPAAADVPPRAPQARSDDDNLIDFDLNFDAPSAPASVTPPPSPDERGEGLHFDLSAFDETPPPPSASTAPDAPRDDGLEFDLSGFDLPPVESTPPPAAPRAGENEAPGALDGLDGLDDFKLDDFALDEASIEDADADSESLASGDEAATKLDLARAYVDMGDAEMARALLGEVLVEGNDTQQHEAQVLMDRLG